MEWVTTSGRSVEEATEAALDQLGVAADEADIEVLEEPKSGLFGRTRGEAKVRGRVRPTEVRPKRDNRRSRGNKSGGQQRRDRQATDSPSGDKPANSRKNGGQRNNRNSKGDKPMNDAPRDPVDPAAVGEAAETFMSGLATAFGVEASVTVQQEDTEIEVAMNGSDLGLLVGPGGRTLTAVQDLVRVAAQRRLGDHDTHLRLDIAGYRERRKASLEAFARKIASQVRESGKALAIEPMASPDRKVIHDVLSTEEGVTTASQGEDPNRRVIVSPS
ncbi:MAG: RNA-binding cell elongation regulator Jag/EloR [Ilumatobacteraceae bacterium]|jgi:spoIIIJ-associated protein